MPRPKPPAPLIRRSICLSAAQWAEFDRRGGAARLRKDMGFPLRVRELSGQGLSVTAIAAACGASRSTVYWVLNNA